MELDFQLIETERLLLRRLGKADAEDFYAYRSQKDVQKFQSFAPKSWEEIEAFLDKTTESVNVANTWFQVAVCLKEDNKLIGDIGIHFTEDELQTEIGYTFSPQHHNKGYAIEAVRAVLGYLFENLKKHRVYASVDPLNLRSIHLLEKLAMRKEAHFVKSYRLEDGWADDVIYAMLEEEWAERRNGTGIIADK